MSGAGRQDGDVAGRDLECLPVLAAELHPCTAAGNAQHLMYGGMVMREVVDAVAPHRAPAIAAEQPLDRGLGILADVDRAPVD